MSRRQARARAVVADSSEEDEAPLPPRAARRAALQLGQSQGPAPAGARSALAVLLAGSQGGGGSNTAAGSSAAAQPKSRRSGRAVAGAARTAAAAGSRQPAAAAKAPGERPAAAATAAAELWAEKHAPSSESDLAVHRKKVQEVRQWLEQQRESLGRPGVTRLLVLTGPPGCGKATLLRILAAALGFEVSEWRPPSAVHYNEARYAGMQHRSRLDEFGEFVARAKMPHLSLHNSRGSGSSSSGAAAGGTVQGAVPAAAGRGVHAAGTQGAAGAGRPEQGQQPQSPRRPGRLPPSLRPTLVVVQDLPHAAGPEQRQQIAAALGELAAAARFPVAVVATETSGKAQQERSLSAAAGAYRGLHKELLAVLDAHGAEAISLNPFTTANTVKALRGVLGQERRELPEADLVAIAEQSGGDLRNAIATLQFVCTGAAAAGPVTAAKARGGTKRKAAAARDDAGQAPGQVGYALRDSSLSLFHALGKLLYNKRLEGPGSQQQGQQQGLQGQGQEPGGDGSGSSSKRQWTANGFWQQAAGSAAASALPLAAWTQRRPMEFDPEAVLAAAGLEAGSVIAFLHENLLHFVEEGAVGDAAGCLEQLSAADAMASGRRWGTSDEMMGDEDTASVTLLDAAAASTAARGVCFCNAHPAPRRWLPLKAPMAFAAQKGLAANAAELGQHTAAAWALQGGLRCLEPGGCLAAEVLPYARAITARCPSPALQRLQPVRWLRFWQGQLHEQQGSGGGGWREEEAAAGGLVGLGEQQQQQQQVDDCIEESDEDW